MNKRDIVIIIFGLIILVAIIFISYFLPEKASNGEIIVLTDKQEYSPGDNLKVKIGNDTEDDICFSTCYPYFIERKEDQWITYKYKQCLEEDKVDSCVNAREVKAFELDLSSIGKGFHRLVIQACVGCKTHELFTKEKELISNQFIIK